MDAPAAAPRDVTAWHGASALCMVLMLVAAVPGWFAGAGSALFAAGLAWCGVQLARRTSPAAYLRLGICLLAMVLMLLPRDPHPGHAMAMPSTGPSAVAVLVSLGLLGIVSTVTPSCIAGALAAGFGLALTP